jgi:hypothetical protein
VASGDTLSSIAEDKLGDGHKWRELYRANRSVVGADPNRIFPNQVLRIPGGVLHSWDKISIQRTWTICDKLPPADVATNIDIIRSKSQGDAGGAAGEGHVDMYWGTDSIGNQEIGAFTSDDDPMRGLNIFDACMRHEIGHDVGEKGAFDQENGQWVFASHGWQKHYETAEVKTVLTAFLSAHTLTMPAGVTSTSAQVIDKLATVNSFNAAAYQTAVNALEAGLWDKIKAEPFIVHLLARSDSDSGVWETQDVIGGRTYHVPYDWYGFASCAPGLYTKKVSTYAMRSPMEWFAEVYATFYADADQPGGQCGTLLAARDAALAADFRTTVHGRHSLGQQTGQTVGPPPPAAAPGAPGAT